MAEPGAHSRTVRDAELLARGQALRYGMRMWGSGIRTSTIAGATATGLVLAASGLGQPAPTEARALPGGWVLRWPSCTVEREADARGLAAIDIEAHYSFLPDIHYQIFLSDRRWPIAITRERYAVDIGFDGAPAAVRGVEVSASMWVGFVPFALTPELRAHMRGANSLEIYRDGQLIGRADLAGMSEALREMEACAAAEAEAYMRDEVTSENMQGPEGNMTELNLTDPGPG